MKGANEYGEYVRLSSSSAASLPICHLQEFYPKYAVSQYLERSVEIIGIALLKIFLYGSIFENAWADLR